MTLAELKTGASALPSLLSDAINAIEAKGINLDDDLNVVIDLAEIAAVFDPPLQAVVIGLEALQYFAPLLAQVQMKGDSPYASTGGQGGGPGEYRGR